ncbi:MAG: efflux RND transporter periplasmic adaptor subunit [Fimbriimonadaceae bacterium]
MRIAPSTSRTINEVLLAVGNVESPYKVEISPKSAGRIAYLQAREGDVVKVGEVLLKIDPSDLQGAVLQQEASVAEARSRLAQAKLTQGSTNVGVSSQIEEQRAGLGSAQANLNQVQTNYAAQVAAAQAQVSAAVSGVSNAQAALNKENSSLINFQTKYDRTNNLFKQGFLAAQDLDDAKTALDVEKSAVQEAQSLLAAAKSQLDVQQQNLLIAKRKGLSDIAASKAAVTQAQATLRMANANRSQTPAYRENLAALQSTVDSAVAQVRQAQARLADTVVHATIAGTVTARKADPGALASPGTPVLEVQFLDWVYVTATLPIDSAAQLREGQPARITFDALPGRTFVGPITNINPAADPTSRQFGVKVKLNNPSHTIRPGMYGRISINTGKIFAPVVVPREAIQTNSDGVTTVIVVDANNVAHVRKVSLGVSDDRSVQITDGVRLGENVVVLAYNAIKDGQKVSIGSSADKKNTKGARSAGGAAPK